MSIQQMRDNKIEDKINELLKALNVAELKLCIHFHYRYHVEKESENKTAVAHLNCRHLKALDDKEISHAKHKFRYK